MNRERPPERRRSENLSLTIPGLNREITVTIGHYANGRPAEVFVSDVKAGTATDAISRDAAVLLSIALQYSVPIDVIAGAITRDTDNKPSSVIGALIDILREENSNEHD